MTWWQRLWGRKKMEEQLEKELRFHLERHEAELIARGVEPAEARRRARLAIGGPEQVKEECRDARGTRWVEDLFSDTGYALRTLRKNPGFTTVALLTIALGIGATTVMFTVVNGVLLKPLPFSEPNRLIAVRGQSNDWNTKIFGKQRVAYLDFRDCQRESRTLDLAAAVFNGGTVSEPGPAEYVNFLYEISSNLFSVLRVPVAYGRDFLPEEDRAGAEPVMILGYSFWQGHFGGNPQALGTSVVLDQKRYTVVGIAQQGFRLYGAEPDVYTPLGQDTAGYLRMRQAHPTNVVGRLRPGATLAQSREEVASIGRHLAQQYADTNKGRSLQVEPLRPEEVEDVRSTLWLLLGAVTLVLLIACANVASLLLARAVSRERELAMRAALGASKGRLVRQCLTESAVLGLSGGALGIVFANLGVRPFVALWPGDLPRAEEVHLDWRVLMFAIGVSLLTGIFFGLAPAMRAPARRLEQALRAGARTVAGSSRRLHSAFVISEIGLAVVLLVSAAMLGRALLRVSGLDPGLHAKNLLVARMALSPATLADPARIPAAWQEVLNNARRVPGVQAAAAVDIVPMRDGNNQLGYWTSPDMPPKEKLPMALASSASPNYLEVMGIRLEQGRFFNDEDRLGRQPVIVIDDVLAKNAFGPSDPIGRHIWIPDMPCTQMKQGPDGKSVETPVDCTEPFTVVGVVRHVRYWGLAGDDQAEVRDQLYYPFAQVPKRYLRRWSELMSISVRTNVPPLSVLKSLQAAVRGAAGDQVLYEVRTMEQLAAASVALHRFLVLLFAIFAGLSLLLACIGIYGVLAYLTNQRVPEIGVRMALGATPGDVVQLVLRQSLGMMSAGVAAGFVGALGAGRVLALLVSATQSTEVTFTSLAGGRAVARLVDGMKSAEPLTFAAMICVLLAAGLIASFVPARRASRIDPMNALRQE
jgi:predicted permease